MARMPLALAWTLVLAGLVGWFCAPTARADDEGIQRLVARMDFEGYEKIGESLPQGWDKSSLPGFHFPSYLNGQLSDKQAHGGKWSFQMGLNGGNVAYTYTGTLNVLPSNDYLMTGWIRTEKLNVARAQARMYFVDASGHPIDGSLTLGEPMGQPGGPSDGQWQFFRVKLRGAFPAATQLRVMLGVLQPQIWQGPACKDIYQQDIEGQAWWDDLAIYRLPRVDLRTDTPGNVFGPGAIPQLRIIMDGVDNADCGAVLTVRNAAGGVRLQHIIDIDASKSHNEMVLPLGDLDVGLYTGELAISAGGRELTREKCIFARLAEVPRTGKSRLGVDAAAIPASQWPELLAYLQNMRASEVKLPAWIGPNATTGPAPTTQNSDSRMQAMLAQLNQLGITPTMVFAELPPSMRLPDQPASTLVDALASRQEPLRQAMSMVVADYGQLVAAWQIGPTYNYESMWNLQLPKAQQTADEWLSKLLVQTRLLHGWNAMFDYDMPSQSLLSLLIPATSMPEQIPAQIANFPKLVNNAHLESLDPQVARLSRLADFALRYAYTRAGGVNQVFIDPPWQISAAGQAEPTEAFLVARTLAAYLGDAKYEGVARLDTTALALVFRKPGGEGLMLVYDRPESPREQDVTLTLPRQAYMVDLWGRKSALTRRNDAVVLRPAMLPFLIAGCDAGSLALRASLRITPQAMPSTYQEHSAQLSFVNPFDQPVTGQVRITSPEGWTIQPRMARFNLAPHEAWTGKLTVSFPYNAPAGLKQFDVNLDIDARQAWSIQAPAFFYLTLEGVVFDIIQSTGSDGSLEVQQVITNRTDKPLSFNCFVYVPDVPRQSRPVQNLAPGATAVKLFRFPNSAKLRGKTLRAGLHGMGGPDMPILNQTAVIR